MNLREYLDEKGIMNKKFAENLGVSENTITQMLKPGYNPQISTVMQVQKLTNGKVKYADWVKQYKEGKEQKDD